MRTGLFPTVSDIFNSLERDLDRYTSKMMKQFHGNPFSGHFNSYQIDNDKYAVEFSVPGMTKKDVEVSFIEKYNMLRIEGEVESGINYLHEGTRVRRVKQDYYLGEDVNVSSIDARVENGLLTVTYEKKKQVIEEGGIKIKIK